MKQTDATQFIKHFFGGEGALITLILGVFLYFVYDAYKENLRFRFNF